MTGLWGELPAICSLILGCVVPLWWLRRSWRRRFWPTALVVAGAAPAVYLGLVWSEWVRDHWLRFGHPWLALVIAPALIWAASRLCRKESLSRIRRLLVEAFTFMAMTSASWAALAPEAGVPQDRLSIVLAIDRSRSVDRVAEFESRLAAERQVAEVAMRPDDRIASIAFGARAVLEDPLRGAEEPANVATPELPRDATNIEEGIRRSLAEVPADSAARIVVFSDGLATSGDALKAASAARAAGVAIDVVVLEPQPVPNLRVDALRVPAKASPREPLELRISLRASAPGPAVLSIERDGELVGEASVSVTTGAQVLRLTERAPDAGLHRYSARIRAVSPTQDGVANDNEASAFVRIVGANRALILEGSVEQTGPLAAALEGAAFLVDRGGPLELPVHPSEFAAYDLIVLSDVPAHQLTPNQLSALASYVRDLGGGLLLMGGPGSFGPGGYGRTPIEEVSPVHFDLKQERRRASLAEAILIDYSGSMSERAGEHTKLELANEAAIRSVELLGVGDQVGVAHVDTTVTWTAPMGPLSAGASPASAIRGVGPGGGGIDVDVALKAAYDALASTQSNLKHTLLFADGSDAENRTQAPSLVQQAKRRGITTSVVALGSGDDVPALEQLSRLGGGRFYLIEDAQRLPTVFAQETILASRSAIDETPFSARPEAFAPFLRGIEFASAPPLLGHVVTVVKPRARVHLLAREGAPLLATWNAGVGRSAAFTSDYKGRWGQAWTEWPGAGRLFAQLARDLARAADDPRVHTRLSPRAGELRVEVRLEDELGKPEAHRRVEARILGQSGFRATSALDEVGQGRYSATIPLARAGAYVVALVDRDSGEILSTRGIVLDGRQELGWQGPDRAHLEQIAAVGNGKVRDTLAGIFTDRDELAFAYRDLTDPLLLMAAAWLLVGVAARRLSLPSLRARRSPAPRSRAAGREPSQESAAASESPLTVDEPRRSPLVTRSTLGRLLGSRRASRAAAPAPIGGQESLPSPPDRSESPERPWTAPAHRPPPASASPPHGPAPEPSQRSTTARAATAAELLLARRRRRRDG